jgi:hypothetical protein
VRLDSTFDGFEGPRAVRFDGGLTPLLKSLRDALFARFVFKRTGLVGADTRSRCFLLVLDFAFVFVAIGLGTYTVYAS